MKNTTTKLRRIGNSIGLYFSKEAVTMAGFTEGQTLQVDVSPGEIKLSAEIGLTVNLSHEEVTEFLSQKSNSLILQNVAEKIRSKLNQPQE